MTWVLLVSYAAVLLWGGALRDNLKNGCVGDYGAIDKLSLIPTKQFVGVS